MIWPGIETGIQRCGTVYSEIKTKHRNTLWAESTVQDKQSTYKRNTEVRSRNHCCCEEAISISYSGWVSVALVIQHAMRMRRITVVLISPEILKAYGILLW